MTLLKEATLLAQVFKVKTCERLQCFFGNEKSKAGDIHWQEFQPGTASNDGNIHVVCARAMAP